MYTSFFGLQLKPFNMTPDPAFLYMTDQHREALAGLSYAILDQKGFMVLSGMAGAGKTTILSWILQKLPLSKVQSSVIVNPTLTPSEFLELAMLDFGIAEVPGNKAHRLRILQKFLLDGQRQGKVSLLIVDEAHKLSVEVLEEIRYLGNFENAEAKLLQVLLIGQRELDQLLDRPELRQFKQRVSVRIGLEALDAEDVRNYIEHRWKVAGGSDRSPFSAEAVANVARWSRGIPRLINSICDNALVQAFADVTKNVTGDHVREAAGDLLLIDRPVMISPLPPGPPPLPQLVPELSQGRKIISSSIYPMQEYMAKQEKPGVFARWAGKLRLRGAP